MTNAALLGAIATIAGCGDDGSAAVDSESSSSTASEGSTTQAVTTGDSSSGADTTVAATSSGSAETSSGESGFDPPEPACGNGFVEPGEDCDDADDDDDACPSDCLFACGLEWELVREGPTPESDIFGTKIATDAAGNVFAIGQQREITVDPKGMQTLGPVTTVVLALDPAGAERWSTVHTSVDGALRPGDVVADDAGDLYLAATVDVAAGGSDVRVSRLAGADGAELWVHDIVAPTVDGEDVATGLALALDGSVVASATVHVADGDDDVWVRRLDGDAGTEVWTTSFDGPSMGMFSTDDGGPVAVGDNGVIAVLAQPYVDFTSAPATVVAFASSGGAPLWTWTPADDGFSQELAPIGIEIGDDGSIYAAYQRITSVVDFFVVRLDDAGAEIWLLDDTQLLPADADDWRLDGLGLTPGGGPVLVGSYDTAGNESWVEAWVVQSDVEGAVRCTITHMGSGANGLPALVFSAGATVDADARPLAVGQWIDEGAESFWVARFRSE